LGESDIYKIDLKDYAILEKDANQKTVNQLSILKGVIRDGNEGGYGLVDAIITIKDEKDALLTNTNTNENGEYFLTLRAGKYTITVQKKGFVDIVEKIELAQSAKETVILDKSYLLKK
jgi:hypothetical protein